jgi:hypothetical protein
MTIEISSKTNFCNMKNRLLHWTIALVFMPLLALAQFDEVGIFTGISTYSGDLTDRDIEPLGFHFGAGLFVRRNLTERLVARGQFYVGKISGSDANTAVESGLWQRNLHFQSAIHELGVLFEYKLLSVKGDYHQFSLNLFGGIAGFHFRPMAKFNGGMYDLHHYQTEGVSYPLTQLALPFGAGLQVKVAERFHIGLEWGLRKTFTDYLDDVSATYRPDAVHMSDNASISARLSYRTPEVLPNAPAAPTPGGQRGNPSSNDWYQFFGLTLSMAIKRK